ncbi:MAG: chromate transporter [Chloroflexota bacterium]|nr:chromate transporter [Chloroflexota bacterium]
MSFFSLFLVFLKASMLSSGGLAPLALLREDLITNSGVLTDGDFAQAVAIGRITPGPNGLFVLSVGFYAGGLPGAVAAALAVMAPPFISIGLVHVHRRIAGRPWVEGMTRGITASAIGLLSAVGYSFITPLLSAPASIAIFALALGVLLFTKLDALPVLLIGAAVGVGCYLVGIPLA